MEKPPVWGDFHFSGTEQNGIFRNRIRDPLCINKNCIIRESQGTEESIRNNQGIEECVRDNQGIEESTRDNQGDEESIRDSQSG